MVLIHIILSIQNQRPVSGTQTGGMAIPVDQTQIGGEIIKEIFKRRFYNKIKNPLIF